jgi:hypothetical protein
MKFYAPLRKAPQLFATVHLINGGSAIAWGHNDEIDMSAQSVARLAAQMMTGDDFKAFLFRHSLTQEAAAACLGRSKRSIAGYTEMEYVPRVIVLACRGWESSFFLPDETIHRYTHKSYFVAEGGTVHYREDDQFDVGAPSVAAIAASEKQKTG